MPLVIFALSVVSIDVLIGSFRSQHINKTLKGIESLFSDETMIGDFYMYAKRLTELENLGLIVCSRLSETAPLRRQFFDSTYKKECKLDELAKREIVPLNRSSLWLLEAQVAELPYLTLTTALTKLGFFAIFLLAAQRTISSSQKSKLLELESNWLRNLTQQVKHDVASPLSALKIATQFPDLNPKLREFLTNAVVRTSEIFDDLDHSHRAQVTKFNLDELILAICHEKGQARINLDLNSGNLLSSKSDLARVISNILNNAVEACPGKAVGVKTSITDQLICIEVSDLGPGFPPSILSQITRGLTINKPGGSGLGLFHANKTVISLGGNLTLRNSNPGAIASIVIPVAPFNTNRNSTEIA